MCVDFSVSVRACVRLCSTCARRLPNADDADDDVDDDRDSKERAACATFRESSAAKRSASTCERDSYLCGAETHDPHTQCAMCRTRTHDESEFAFAFAYRCVTHWSHVGDKNAA